MKKRLWAVAWDVVQVILILAVVTFSWMENSVAQAIQAIGLGMYVTLLLWEVILFSEAPLVEAVVATIVFVTAWIRLFVPLPFGFGWIFGGGTLLLVGINAYQIWDVSAPLRSRLGSWWVRWREKRRAVQQAVAAAQAAEAEAEDAEG